MSRPGTELSATQLGYVRGGRPILTDVTLTAYAGQAVAITGPSGSGKSSLLALLAGLERPTTGEVRLGGDLVRPGSSGWRLRQRFGVVLQGYGLVSVLTAAENVELVLQARGRPAAEVTQRARAALERVGMAVAAGRLVEELSGGQQQRVAVARALVAEPDVILADEPTAELDAGNRQRILSLLLDEAQRGRIVVLASHDREVADACDSELHLMDGRLRSVVSEPAAGEGEPVVHTAADPVPGHVDQPEPRASGWAHPKWEEEAEPASRSQSRTPIPARTGWERPDDDREAARNG